MSNNNGHVKPRIFIGVPCYSKVDHEVLEDWMRFAYHLGRRMPQYDFFLGIKAKAEQFRARNTIVDEARKVNADWLLMLDDDMVIDTFGTRGVAGEGDPAYDFLEKMIQHDRDICGVLYWQRGGNCEPVVMARVNENGYRFLREDELKYGLQKVDVAGGGCLLVKMRVFDKVQYPYFAPEYQWGTDVQLCRKATEAGFEVWADTSIELGHLKDEKVVVTARNRKSLQFEAVPGETTRSFVAADVYSALMTDALEYTGRPNAEAMYREADAFMDLRHTTNISDDEWYRLYPMERVCRQVWFNTMSEDKKKMTQFIISAIDPSRKMKILDFGCGIGITAFALAQQGHDVTALDIRGTGTLEFLKWRAAKHAVPIRFIESEGGVPQLTEKYDVIIAMDSIEHVKEWQRVVGELGLHVKVGGALFANNGILEDTTHPEHYDITGADFIKTCVTLDLMPVNQITFVRRKETAVYA